mmetsp:Transcript_66027/g.120473  ORF Transcript_66027/g.120473 Transcript_66027/m.120473 type:complete len:245 (+) Transcript_66027:239-973(+)
MAPSIQESSNTTSAAVMEHIHSRVDTHTLGNGRMTSNVAMEWNSGQIVLSSRANSRQVRSTDGAGSHGKTVALTKANSLLMTSTARVRTHGQMGDGTLDNGSKTRWALLGLWAGLTVEPTRASFKMVVSTATACTAGRMAGRTAVSGSTAASMELAQLAQTMGKNAVVCGRRANLSSGWMEDPLHKQDPKPIPVALAAIWSKTAVIMEGDLMVAPKAQRQQRWPVLERVERVWALGHATFRAIS